MCHHLNANSNMMRPYEERERERGIKKILSGQLTRERRACPLPVPARARITLTETHENHMNSNTVDSNESNNIWFKCSSELFNLLLLFVRFIAKCGKHMMMNASAKKDKHTDTHIRCGVRYQRTSQSQTQTQPHTSTGCHRNEYRWHWWKWMMRYARHNRYILIVQQY